MPNKLDITHALMRVLQWHAHPEGGIPLSWDEEIMKEDNRKVPEKKPLRHPKIGDITLKSCLGFIPDSRVQGGAYFRDFIVFS